MILGQKSKIICILLRNLTVKDELENTCMYECVELT